MTERQLSTTAHSQPSGSWVGGPGSRWHGPVSVILLLAGLPALAAPRAGQRSHLHHTALRVCHVTQSVAVGSVTISPSSVTGGESAAGAVELDGPAPAGGLTLDLSSDHPPLIGTPGFVTVPAGAARATFPITTEAGAGPETDHVEARVRGRRGVVGAITVMPGPPRKAGG